MPRASRALQCVAAAIAILVVPTAACAFVSRTPGAPLPGEEVGGRGQKCDRRPTGMWCEDGLRCLQGWCYGKGVEPPDSYLFTPEASSNWGRIEDTIFEGIDLKPGDVVADVGAGPGFYLKRVAKLVHPGGKVYGTEIVKDMVPMIRARAAELDAEGVPHAPIEGRFVKSPRETSLDDLGPNTLSVVMFVNSVQFSPGKSREVNYLKRFCRLLKPGGRLVVHVDWVYDDSATAEDVTDLARRAGFEVPPRSVPLPDFLPERTLWEPCPGCERVWITKGYTLIFRKACGADGKAKR